MTRSAGSPRRPRRPIPVLLLVAGACAAACAPPAEPRLSADVSGAYRLRSIGGVPLPYRWGPGSDALVTVADTLFLDGGGGVTQRLVRRQPPEDAATVLDVPGSYVRSGAQLQLSFVRRMMVCTLGQRDGRTSLDCPVNDDVWVYTR